MRRTVVAAALVILTVSSTAYAQATHLAIIVGLAGQPEHAELFQRWATTLVEAAGKVGVEPQHIVYLADNPKRVTGRSTKEEITKAFAALAMAPEDDVVFIVLIGHGTFDGKVAKFNLPGPDMTPADFDPLLKRLKSRQHGERQRALHGDTGGAGPDDRHGDPHGKRAVCNALRRIFRRRAGWPRCRRG